MKIWTSRYSCRHLARMDAAMVGITAGWPRWHLGYHATRRAELAPDRPWMNAPRELYEPLYLAKLEALGVDAVMGIITQASVAADGADVVLLCFEDLRNPALWCHRRMLAHWIQRKTGIVVEEISESDPPPFEAGGPKKIAGWQMPLC